MLTPLVSLRKTAARIFVLLSALWLTACDVVPTVGGGGGPSIDPSKPVRVALLVPGGSGKPTDAALAANFENAARMAVADLGGRSIDLRVYNTAGNPQQAAMVAQAAVADGAKIIVGPLYSQSANAAGVAASSSGVNVLSFSNTPTIAGGNVFVLGNLFENTANRLVRYAAQQGVTRYYIASANDLQGELGAAAAVRAVRASGGQVVGAHTYALSQQDLLTASSVIAQQAQAAGAQAIIVTANVGTELQLLGNALPTEGIDPAQTRMIGLTRWDARSEMLQVPGLQGGYFAMPDLARQRAFEQRYTAAYGQEPLPLAGLAYDAIAAVGALIATGDSQALSRAALTRRQGFQGTQGIFRLMQDGHNQRGLSVATVENGAVRVLSPAPSSFANGAG